VECSTSSVLFTFQNSFVSTEVKPSGGQTQLCHSVGLFLLIQYGKQPVLQCYRMGLDERKYMHGGPLTLW